MNANSSHMKRALALLVSGTLVAPGLPAFAPGIPEAGAATSSSDAAETRTSSSDEDQEDLGDATLTRDSDGFFAALSSDGEASFKTKIGLADLEKLGIYFSEADARADGVKDTHVEESGKGSLASPVTNGSTDGASISYSKLCTITVDQSTFDRGAELTYTNNNGVEVTYNKRDVVQAVLYAISQTTQDPDFDGKTMYRVHVDYDGEIDLTNTVFVYSNTWLQLNEGTVMLKQFQGKDADSTLADRNDAKDRAVGYTSENILRNTAGEFKQGGYAQCQNIVIDGGTWDANIEHYNRANLGDTYQTSATKFSHMKNLVVQNTTFKGANLAHHLELAGIRDVTVTGSTFTGYDGKTDKEAIQIETLHSKGSTRECEPFDDTPTRDIVIYDNTFSDCCRGIGNHAYVLGLDSTRIYVYKNAFRNLSAQAVLTTGCRDMRIEDNTMTNVGTGVDVRVTKYNNGTNVSMPVYENWTYDELVDNGFLNRNIKIVGNTISATGGSSLNATDCAGVAISVKGQTISASNTKVVTSAAGSYTITGVTVRNNTVTSANGTALRYYNTSGCVLEKNTVLSVNEHDGRAIGLYTYKTDGLTVSGNNFFNSDRRGAYLLNSSGLKFTGNIFSGMGTDGIYASNSPSLDLEKNTFSNIGDNGVKIEQSSGMKAQSNELSQVGDSAFSLSKSKKATLSGNSLSGIGGNGVYLASASNGAQVKGNSIKMPNGNPGILATSAVSNTKATGNTIVTSGIAAIKLGSKQTVTFKVGKKTAKKITGTTASKVTVAAYANGKKLGSATSGKKGKFKIKFAKKQKKGSSVQLRRKDGSGNSIRKNVTI